MFLLFLNHIDYAYIPKKKSVTVSSSKVPKFNQDKVSFVSNTERVNSASAEIREIEDNYLKFATSDSSKENMAKFISELKKKYAVAKSVASRIEACKQNIGNHLAFTYNIVFNLLLF